MTAQMDRVGYDSGEAIPYVDSRIYSDRNIFEEELEKIWQKVWLATVHESELPEALDPLATFLRMRLGARVCVNVRDLQ